MFCVGSLCTSIVMLILIMEYDEMSTELLIVMNGDHDLVVVV